MFVRSSLAVVLAAAGLLPALVSAAPVAAPSPRLVSRTYHMYSGSGSSSDFWPRQDEWVAPFDEMFEQNARLMAISCAQFGAPNNTPDEISAIKSAITSVASDTGVDGRFILAIMMQETKGCVRAPTTNNGVRNPGLLQCHNGSASCNDGSVKSPCPSSTIHKMIEEGVKGTSAGHGLLKLIESAGGVDDDSAYYKAARKYNSGSIASSGNLGDGGATKCYASDIANRLTGWVDGESKCCLDQGCGVQAPIRNHALTKVVQNKSQGKSQGKHQGIAGAVGGAKLSKKLKVEAKQKAPSLDETSESSSSDSCSKKATPARGTNCDSFASDNGISTDELRELNPSIDDQCSNLLAGHEYCIA